MIKSALFILSGNAAMSILLLARNLIIARMIPVADYGIASTFAVVMAVVEMASSLGLQQQIVQSKQGDDPAFQAALQGFQVFRGVLSGAALFAIAGPMARFMGVPEVIWGYQLLAVVPVLNALVHFDIHRMNRQMVFWPMLLTGAFPALLSVVAVWPLSHYMGDWRVLLYAILIQGAVAVVVSHLVAERPYRLTYNGAILKGALRFGWPLLINAILLFFVFQGDRMIVARLLGMSDLAVFSMGVTLTLTPTLVMAKTAQNFFLPQLSKLPRGTVDEEAAFDRMGRIILQAALMNGAIVVLVISVLGAILVNLVLGVKYQDLIPLLVPLAILSGLRVCKSGPGVVSLAQGHTGNALVSNLPRVLALPLVWITLQADGQLSEVIWIGVAAEVCGYAVSLFVMQGPKLRFLVKALFAFAMFLAAILWIDILARTQVIAPWISVPAALLLFAALSLTMSDLNAYLRNAFKRKTIKKET
ncbi:MAG: oligosaccharide flippase family protein [Microgenomates group bacterium]